MDYELFVEGEMLDTTDDTEPIQFIQGHGEILPALEKELYGMKPGETREVSLSPDEAYGEVEPDSIVDVSRDEFPEDFPLRPGVELEVTDKEGETLLARIRAVHRHKVKLDFNHPLAGKDLRFVVTIAGLRAATESELAHGHVHDLSFEDEIFDEDLDEVDFDGDDLGAEFDDEDFDDVGFEDEDFDEAEFAIPDDEEPDDDDLNDIDLEEDALDDFEMDDEFEDDDFDFDDDDDLDFDDMDDYDDDDLDDYDDYDDDYDD